MLEMAADILDSKRLKVECVCVCVSKADRGTSQSFLQCISASYLSELLSHTESLTAQWHLIFDCCCHFIESFLFLFDRLIMIIGCEVNNLLISAKWELD